MCGGTRQPGSHYIIVQGLSPRVRGNLFAPASASWSRSCWAVYPRVCGEPFIVSVPNRICAVYPRVCGGTCERRAWL